MTMMPAIFHIYTSLLLLMIAAGTSQAQDFLFTIFSCEEIIETHVFDGTCCSLSDTENGGCQLTVLNGICQPSGPVWFNTIVNNDPGTCPEDMYKIVTLSPSLSLAPSSSPTTAPSDEPTMSPSSSPSDIPTTVPTANPSSEPSASPSSVPSADPTTSPSAEPSDGPSSEPSQGPTGTPSVIPSQGPTSEPSQGPSGGPTSSPSSRPSPTGTFEPTLSPTLTPTTFPSPAPITITSSPTGSPIDTTSSPTFSPSTSQPGPGTPPGMTTAPSTSQPDPGTPPGATTAPNTSQPRPGTPPGATTAPTTSQPDPAATTRPDSTVTPSAPPTGTTITDSPVLPPQPAVPSSCQNDEDCTVCPLGCPPEFCGTDDICHVWTCQNFFRFHREPEFDGTGDNELTCVDTETDIHISNFGCQISVGTLAPPPGVGMKSNRACSGLSKNNGEEVIEVLCYDVEEGAADYVIYAIDAENTDIVCNDVGPFFFYSASYSLEDVRTSFSVSDTVIEARATVVLDPMQVAESMYAYVYKDVVSIEPSMTPTEVPVAASSSPSSGPTSDVTMIPSAQPTADVNLAETPSSCVNNTNCPEQFCGTDGNCYDYTCDNFFRWNPITEFDGTGDPELSCESRATSIDIINYGCSRTVGTTTGGDGVGLPSNQRCIGRSRDEEELVTVECYNLADGTDFSNFVAQTEELVLFCVDGQVPLPRYFYGVGYTLSEFQDGRFQSTTQTFNGPLRTEEFNATKALKAMFAVVVTEPITPAPTRTPTSPPPTPQATLQDIESVASKTSHSYWTCILLTTLTWWLLSIIAIP